jgi:hypothetical protein
LGCTITGNGSSSSDYQLGALGPQTVGYRFMIGVTSLADARRYDLGTASLLTYTKPGTPAKFTSAKGMTFVAPTPTALRAAAGLLTLDKAAHDWTFPYSRYLADSPTVADAYPGAMLVYADIPTSGLPSADAGDYATFLRFAATDGQQPGGAIGQLPAGYLPMTTADHLGTEAAYTLAAATAVARQKGTIPPLIPKPHKAGGGKGSTTKGGSGSGGTGPSTTPTVTPTPNPTPTPTKSSVPLSGSHPVAKVALTPTQNFGLAAYVLPAVAGLALAGGIAAAVATRWTRFRAKRWG